MTALQRLKHMILIAAYRYRDTPLPEVTADNVDQLYSDADDGEMCDDIQDARNDVRSGQVETGLKCDWSRHYESKAVAAQAVDGSWIGWTYWYGGGKHGEPEAIDWMEDAYDLACVEEEKVVTVRTFSHVVSAA